MAITVPSDLKMVNCKIGPFLTVGWNWMGTLREQFFARNLCTTKSSLIFWSAPDLKFLVCYNFLQLADL